MKKQHQDSSDNDEDTHSDSSIHLQPLKGVTKAKKRLQEEHECSTIDGAMEKRALVAEEKVEDLQKENRVLLLGEAF